MILPLLSENQLVADQVYDPNRLSVGFGHDFSFQKRKAPVSAVSQDGRLLYNAA
jgi:hypothetical protein